jgi:beta-lactamase class D
MQSARALLVFVGAALLASLAVRAHAAIICRVVADASSGAIILQDGDCERRTTPASTFKIALAAMGYDSGVLSDADTPVLPFRKGYPDWGGDAWRKPNSPSSWMRHSVVWYSQQIAAQLGVSGLRDYGQKFGYGNSDFSGDPGKNNALERSWISSSLKISPLEQVGFLTRLITGKLPITRDAALNTMSIIEGSTTTGGWSISGKTGSAFPRNADGSFNRARGWGWYVGWARNGEQTLVFAHLAQDERKEQGPAGLRARASLLADWDSLVPRMRR